MNPFKMAKLLNVAPKWQNFAKSSHAVGPTG